MEIKTRLLEIQPSDRVTTLAYNGALPALPGVGDFWTI